MPRSPRIEFEGAIYHVMARGNRREPIVFDDSDRELFVETFGEACTKTGWEVFAWVLMDNHYHAVFRTPQPNLVEGMKWMQNAYTRRLNAKHKLWGHLFGGRYRSILVENEAHGGATWRDYLRTAVDYVHLNPARAGLVDGDAIPVDSYPWSSLASAFARSKSKRPDWMAITEVLDLFQEKDTPGGRRNFLARLDEWIRDERGDPMVEETSFGDRIQRGWVWGAEDFKEAMLDLLEEGLDLTVSRSGTNRTYQGSEAVRESGETRAERIVARAIEHFKIEPSDLVTPVRRDLTRAAIAARIYSETTASQQWIAEKLAMRSAPNVCQQIRRLKNTDEEKLPKSIRRWMRMRGVSG